jgi:GNAT superfamily N-acetyltransferase
MFEIRPATPEDADGIVEVLQGHGGPPSSYLEPDQLAPHVHKTIAECLSREDTDLLICLDPEGMVLGYMSLHWYPYLFAPGSEGYLAELFVHPAKRGQGVGGQLLKHAEEEGRNRGCFRLLLLNLKSRESYKRGFYTKGGWTEREDLVAFMYPYDKN